MQDQDYSSSVFFFGLVRYGLILRVFGVFFYNLQLFNLVERRIFCGV